jgi:hypothetical protein
LVFMGSSFRRRRQDVCGGLQLRGATEWMNPEHLFSSGVVSVADRAPRTDKQPALPSGPSPVGSHPVFTRRPRAVRSGRPSEGGDAEVPQRDLEFLKRPSPAVISRSDFDGRFPPQLGQLGVVVPAPERHQGDVELAGNLGSGTSLSGASSGRSGFWSGEPSVPQAPVTRE